MYLISFTYTLVDSQAIAYQLVSSATSFTDACNQITDSGKYNTPSNFINCTL